jgi:dsDNA-binding SOS-regulon protein
MAKAQEAFEKLRAFLATTPTLVSPEKGEPLLLYIATTTQVVSVALVIEREESRRSHKIQMLVYFISIVLLDTKVRYP